MTLRKGLRAALAALGAVALVALGAATYWAGRGDAPSPVGGIGWTATPKALPEMVFVGAAESAYALENFRGKLVLLNTWATWRAPCREEKPALDRLQLALGGPDFEVVAFSIDREGSERWRKSGPDA